MGDHTQVEFGSIEREIHIDASPEVVFEVISRPEHVREWWPEEATFESAPGSDGELVFDHEGSEVHVPMTVLDVDPPTRFSFRWIHPEGEVATPTNSLLVTFDLVPSGRGTTVRLTETGFREQGWEAAKLEAYYNDHVEGWGHHFPRLGEYVTRLVAAT